MTARAALQRAGESMGECTVALAQEEAGSGREIAQSYRTETSPVLLGISKPPKTSMEESSRLKFQ